MEADQLPKFLPKKWILFKMGTTFGMGKIKGAHSQAGKWQYLVTNPLDTGSRPILYINEEDILRQLEGTNWTTV
jgi:hypothetical protein